jgi:hypothetical protein
MALRLMVYIGMLYRELIKTGEMKASVGIDPHTADR